MSIDVIITAIVTLIAVLTTLGWLNSSKLSKGIAGYALKGQQLTGKAKKITDAVDKMLTDAAEGFGDGSIDAKDLKDAFVNGKNLLDVIKNVNQKLK